MSPVVVDGLLRPDLDHRWVRPALMAEYLGIKPWCLWKWRSDGHIPAAACKAFGRTTRYCAAVYFAETRRLAGVP